MIHFWTNLSNLPKFSFYCFRTWRAVRKLKRASGKLEVSPLVLWLLVFDCKSTNQKINKKKNSIVWLQAGKSTNRNSETKPHLDIRNEKRNISKDTKKEFDYPSIIWITQKICDAACVSKNDQNSKAFQNQDSCMLSYHTSII